MPTVIELPLSFWIVVGVVLLLQLLTWITLLIQGGRIRRLAARDGKPASAGVASPSVEPDPGAEADSGGVHFREFLDENPARRELSKKEQSAEFRKWRSQRGLNWDSKRD